MKRSLAVTLSAILSLVGSSLTLLLGILLLCVLIFAPRQGSFPGGPETLKVFLLLCSLIYIIPAIWGIITSIGLLRLKNWARISIIVFSVILILMAGLTGLITLVITLPAVTNGPGDHRAMTAVIAGMAAFCFLLVGIGVWWLILFNRANVKAQFVASSPALTGASQLGPVQIPALAGQTPGSNRPVSITILAWLLLAGCAYIPLNLVLHTPAIFLTRVLTGAAASFYYMAFLVVHLYLGIGLLRLNPTARVAGIGYYLLILANTSVFYFAPGAHDRVMALFSGPQAVWPWMRGMSQSTLPTSSTERITDMP